MNSFNRVVWFWKGCLVGGSAAWVHSLFHGVLGSRVQGLGPSAQGFKLEFFRIRVFRFTGLGVFRLQCGGVVGS